MTEGSVQLINLEENKNIKQENRQIINIRY